MCYRGSKAKRTTWKIKTLQYRRRRIQETGRRGAGGGDPGHNLCTLSRSNEVTDIRRTYTMNAF